MGGRSAPGRHRTTATIPTGARTGRRLDESWAPKCVVWMLTVAVVAVLVLLVTATVRRAVEGVELDGPRGPEPAAVLDAG